jgi:hypothetical protein
MLTLSSAILKYITGNCAIVLVSSDTISTTKKQALHDNENAVFVERAAEPQSIANSQDLPETDDICCLARIDLLQRLFHRHKCVTGEQLSTRFRCVRLDAEICATDTATPSVPIIATTAAAAATAAA